jgi:hypothetical protein
VLPLLLFMEHVLVLLVSEVAEVLVVSEVLLHVLLSVTMLLVEQWAHWQVNVPVVCLVDQNSVNVAAAVVMDSGLVVTPV